MVILENSVGQLGNKLLVSTHATAYCISRNEPLLNGILGNDATYFSALTFARNRILIVGNKKLRLLLHLLINGLQRVALTLFSHPLFDTYQVGWVHTELKSLSRKTNSGLWLSGEGFRSTADIQLNQDLIRRLFTPKAIYRKKVDRIINDLKQEVTLLVGVHVRRGDYKQWQGGKYYFSYETYMNYMMQAKRLFDGSTVCFVLCSDEPINTALFQSFNVYVSANEVIVDLYLLAQCDYLIGPPSTFSSWASFYGQVPLRIIEHSNDTITRDQFTVQTL